MGKTQFLVLRIVSDLFLTYLLFDLIVYCGKLFRQGEQLGVDMYQKMAKVSQIDVPQGTVMLYLKGVL